MRAFFMFYDTRRNNASTPFSMTNASTMLATNTDCKCYPERSRRVLVAKSVSYPSYRHDRLTPRNDSWVSFKMMYLSLASSRSMKRSAPKRKVNITRRLQTPLRLRAAARNKTSLQHRQFPKLLSIRFRQTVSAVIAELRGNQLYA